MSTTYLRDAWYVAAWPADVTHVPLRRVLLDEPIVFFRRDDGKAAALEDRCPHRWAPLSRGSVRGNDLECGYHGLRFDANGMCTLNPHGDGKVPASARVRAYPVAEKHGAIWIWMGSPDRADESTIPDFSICGQPQNHTTVSGYLHVRANYQLITDNLLDLSHTPYIHPGLTSRGNPRTVHEVRQDDDDTVWSLLWRYGAFPNALLAQWWPAEKQGDHYAHMRWNAPSAFLLNVGLTESGQPESEGVRTPNVHFLAPETEISTHYFWAFVLPAESGAEVIAATRAGADQAFANEDIPTIEAQQANAPRGELALLDCGLLATDSAAIRARKVLQRRIAAEA